MIKAWFSRPLWQRVAVAFGAGITVGVIFGPDAAILKIFGDIYLNLMRMMVVPLAFFTIASSIAQVGKSDNITRLFIRTLAWFLLTSSFGVLVGFLFAKIFGPGLNLGHLPLGDYVPKEIPSPLEVLLAVIPSNPVRSMVESNILQILIFASIFGASVVSLGNKADTIKNFLTEGTALSFRMTRWILQLTPIGTFGLMAWVVGHYGFESLFPLAKFVIVIYVACIFHIIVIYGGLLKLHGLKVGKFFKNALPAQQMAFATSSSIATMPLTLRTTIEKFGVPSKFASFAVPLGTSMKMDGCAAIYPAVSAIFIAQYFSVDLNFSHYALIAVATILGSIGTAGAPGTSIVMLTLALMVAGLPFEGIGYIIAIDRVVDMIRTVTNVTGQMLVPILVAKEEGLLYESIYNGVVSKDVSESINPVAPSND